MSIILPVFIFVLGLSVGSFLNVAVARYNTGVSLGGRSRCFSCGAVLTWRELIPLASFVVQRARCRTCKSAISWQYPAVEFATALLFLGVHVHFFIGVVDAAYLLSTFYYMVVTGLLVVITVYDIRHKIIPDPFVFGLALLAGFGVFVSLGSVSLVVPSVWHVLAAPVLFAPFALLWLVSRGRWMGFGDAKLAWALGWLLGLSGGVSAIVLSFWFGAAWGGGVFIVQNIGFTRGKKLLTMKSEVPFAPFMVLGALAVVLFGFDLLSLLAV